MVLINPSAPKPDDPHNKPHKQPILGPGGTHKPHGANPNAPKPKIPSNNPAGLPPDRKFEVGKGGWGAYKKWLGPKGYKQFQAMLCKNISKQIGKDKVKEQKRKEAMLRSIQGQDPNSV